MGLNAVLYIFKDELVSQIFTIFWLYELQEDNLLLNLHLFAFLCKEKSQKTTTLFWIVIKCFGKQYVSERIVAYRGSQKLRTLNHKWKYFSVAQIISRQYL